MPLVTNSVGVNVEKLLQNAASVRNWYLLLILMETREVVFAEH